MEKNEPKKVRTPRKPRTIAGPDGTQYPIHMMHPQIIKGDEVVRNVINMAEKLSEISEHYYHQIFALVDAHLATTAETYGEKWQGNCSLTTYDGTMRVEVDVQNLRSYDERLQVASEKIRSWIDSKLEQVTDSALRKTLEQVSQIAKTALRIDHKGQIDQKKLIQLRKFEFTGEPQWQEAMDLITASERIIGTKRYIRFKKADPATGKLEPIVVDFSRM